MPSEPADSKGNETRTRDERRTRVRSYGAAMTVTGSCHLLDTGGVNVLVDCGAFQGSAALGELNHQPFGFDVQSIDAVLVTHAHMDHAARLPLLVKRGYSGPIYALPATAMLAEHLLLDGAKIQAEDAHRDRRRGKVPEEPLFDEDDVHTTLELFKQVHYDQTTQVAGSRSPPRWPVTSLGRPASLSRQAASASCSAVTSATPARTCCPIRPRSPRGPGVDRVHVRRS